MSDPIDDLIDDMQDLGDARIELRVVVIDGLFYFCEVVYGHDGEIMFWDGPQPPIGESFDELGDDLSGFINAIRKPILKQVGEDEFAKLILWEGK